MRKTLCITLLIFLASVSIALAETPKSMLQVNLSKEQVHFLTVQFGVPETVVIDLGNRLGSVDEVATVLFLSKHGKVDVQTVARMRLEQKLSLAAIMEKLRISVNPILIPPIDRGTIVIKRGPPFGKAIGYYTRSAHVRRPGKVAPAPMKIKLGDREIQNRVLLLTTSQAFLIPVSTELRLLEGGKTFTTLIVENQGKMKASGKTKGNY